MPTRPKSVCTTPRCPNRTDGGRCEPCLRRYRQLRPQPFKAFYQSREWRELSARVLSEEPTCACGRPSQHADHLQSIAKARHLALSRSNVSGKCASCHARKTCQVDGGFGNGRREAESQL